MKLQIDTTNKSIKIENDIKLSDLISNLKKMFPNNEWKKFTLVTNTIIEQWTSPIIIREYPRPYYPYEWPWYHTMSGGQYAVNNKQETFELKSGVYNVDLAVK